MHAQNYSYVLIHTTHKQGYTQERFHLCHGPRPCSCTLILPCSISNHYCWLNTDASIWSSLFTSHESISSALLKPRRWWEKKSSRNQVPGTTFWKFETHEKAGQVEASWAGTFGGKGALQCSYLQLFCGTADLIVVGGNELYNFEVF